MKNTGAVTEPPSNETHDSASNPTVSVLIGVYNEEQYIEASLQSLLDQTFEDFEIIVVDDCSTDSSVEIVRDFNDSRIQLLENEKNIGLTKSLNRALEVAAGKYIARQDADDLSHPSRLEREVEYIKSNEDVALVGTGAYLIDGDGTIQQERMVLGNVSFDDLVTKNHIIHGSVLARKDVFEAVDRYDEVFKYSQDLDMWLRIAEEYKIRNIPEPLYYFRIHDESVYFSSKESSMLYAQLALRRATDGVRNEVIQDVQENGIEAYYKHLTNEQQQAFHESLAERYLRYGHLEEAREQCRQAFELDALSLKARLLYTLSYFGQTPIDVIHETVRRIINAKLKLRNRFN
ncbi:glycosyltransferase [Halorubrum sp. GN11_10-6_MGM]|uniref:glycosyltransferase family 2 protein n=1 Tax=Halorubrum sp. GN11_10-6_MGM TaxID=2518112 RepID=UPI0010F5E289|nr:glycosyltransferase [Halorubrum sp. GN11_10-6_MGM]TKX72879.1 glycosyltransferase [Halorubrum sp. GN11_10-6_MGM]